VKKLVVLIVATGILTASSWGQAQTAQSSAGTMPADVKKVLAEIAGGYDFEYQGGALTVNVFEQAGKLFGTSPGESPEEMLQVQGNPLKFKLTASATGQFYELEFFRNEAGKIDRCMMKTQGIELLGKKREGQGPPAQNTVARSESGQPSTISVKEWNEDLEYLIKRLEIMHPNLYGNVSREAFYGYAEKLRNKISSSTTNEMIIGIHELIAHIKNLHTFCTPVSSSPGLEEIKKTYRYYPVGFYPFEDGLYIRTISKKYGGACGKKVIKIGSLTAEEAMHRLSRFVAADNEMTVLEYLPRFFMNDGPLLQYIGASHSSDDIHLLLADEQGRELDYAIQTDVGMSAPVFMNEESKNPAPLYLKQAYDSYWYEYLPERTAIYLQINAFVDKKNEPFDKFCKRMFEAFDERRAERLIVDVRRNAGGNHIEWPLVKGILNRPGLDRPDRLFIIIGRATVSAAQHFVSEIVRYTNATLFGEPTCSKPNQYGAIRRFNLPHSKLQIGCSVDYYQDAQPFDFSVGTEPHFFVRLTSADFRENRDPVFERIFDYDSYKNMRPEFTAQMADAYRSSGLEGLKSSYDRIRLNYDKYGFNMKNLLYDDLDGWMAINKKTDDDYIGYLTFVHNELPRAIDVCYDLASWLERSGHVEEAKKYYKKCLQLNPEHSYARMKLGLLDLEENVKKTTGEGGDRKDGVR